MATTVHRGPGGSVIYKPAYHVDIPSLDLLTVLFGKDEIP